MDRLQRFCGHTFGWAFCIAGIAGLVLLATMGQAKERTSKSRVKVVAATSKIDAEGRQKVLIRLKIDEGWHLHANPVGNKGLERNRTEVSIRSQGPNTTAKVVYPEGKPYKQFDTDMLIYEGEVDVIALVQRAPGDVGPLQISVRYYACNDNACLPKSIVTINVP